MSRHVRNFKIVFFFFQDFVSILRSCLIRLFLKNLDKYLFKFLEALFIEFYEIREKNLNKNFLYMFCIGVCKSG